MKSWSSRTLPTSEHREIREGICPPYTLIHIVIGMTDILETKKEFGNDVKMEPRTKEVADNSYKLVCHAHLACWNRLKLKPPL